MRIDSHNFILLQIGAMLVHLAFVEGMAVLNWVAVSNEEESDSGFWLDGLRIEPSAGCISGPGGEQRVDPKVMAVLELLADNAGHVITREQLLDSIWTDRVVTDDVVSRCIYQLRGHLSSAGADKKYRLLIETLPKRGYLLNATVVRDEQPMMQRRTRRYKRLIMALGILLPTLIMAWWLLQRADSAALQNSVALAPKTIAVLPFLDLSPESNQGYFADGIAEELINVLSRIPSLLVIARSSSFDFRGNKADIAMVAAKLGANLVLEGSVRTDGERVRVTVQLIDVIGEVHLWSQTYDRKLADVLVIQDEIAASVAGTLQLVLNSAVQSAGNSHVDGRAYASFLHAQFLYNRRGPGDLGQAVALYREAVDRDPSFARAWGAMAGAYYIQAIEGEIPLRAGFELLREAARQALVLDPNQPEALVRMAIYMRWAGDQIASRWYYQQAIEHGGNQPLLLATQAGDAIYAGNPQLAVEFGRAALQLDPLSVAWRANLVAYLIAADNLDEARAEVTKALALAVAGDMKDSIGILLVQICVLQGDLATVVAQVQEFPTGWQREFVLALLRSAQGDFDRADVQIAKLAATENHLAILHLAELYAYRGNTEAAFATLARLGTIRSSGSALKDHHSYYGNLMVSPFLRPLHKDPRWDELLSAVSTNSQKFL